jgi:hydrogenase maturation factor
MVGFVRREKLIDKSDVRQGDAVLLTKAIAVEGTSILAREKEDLLVKTGVSRDIVGRAQRMIEKPGISIVPEALIASEVPAVTALHDITEGGIATAVEELSTATGHRIGIQPSRIPLYPETREICSALGLDPLGLIGSGSLLIVVRETSIENLIKQLQSAGIQVTRIGTVLEPGDGVQSLDDSRGWPSFQRDEIARAFEDTQNGAVDSRTN